jgi:hypothetical protein
MATKVYVQRGETIEKLMPWSEVMTHMGMAGTVQSVYVAGWHGWPMVHVINPTTGHDVCGPVTLGEAGFYEDSHGFYFYPKG